MNRGRLTRLESRIIPKKGFIELPVFLEREGEFILFTDSLLQDLGINPEDYPSFKKPLPPEGFYEMTQTGRKVGIGADFISRIEGESYLYLKGYETSLIILENHGATRD